MISIFGVYLKDLYIQITYSPKCFYIFMILVFAFGFAVRLELI